MKKKYRTATTTRRFSERFTSPALAASALVGLATALLRLITELIRMWR
jgi:hypothetical protein